MKKTLLKDSIHERLFLNRLVNIQMSFILLYWGVMCCDVVWCGVVWCSVVYYGVM